MRKILFAWNTWEVGRLVLVICCKQNSFEFLSLAALLLKLHVFSPFWGGEKGSRRVSQPLLRGWRNKDVGGRIELSNLRHDLNKSLLPTRFLGILHFSPKVKSRKQSFKVKLSLAVF